jgi:hypothetical protein
MRGVEVFEGQASETSASPTRDCGHPPLGQRAQMGQGEQGQAAQRKGEDCQEAREAKRAADLDVLEAEATMGILEALLDPLAL